MKVKKKKKPLGPRAAAKIIAENIWDHLKTLSPREREKRIQSGLTYMKAKTAKSKTSSGSVDTHSKHQDSGQTGLTRLVARSDR